MAYYMDLAIAMRKDANDYLRTVSVGKRGAFNEVK